MRAIFLNTLARQRDQILGWGFSFAALGWFVVWSYNFLAAQKTQTMDLFNSFPPEFNAFVGDITKIFTTGGYLDSMLFSYGIVLLAFFPILIGSGLLAGEEEAGRLDLIQAYPISRMALFAGRLSGLIVSVVAVLLLTWIGLIIGLPGSHLETTVGALALPMLASFAELMLFTGLAVFLSVVLPSRTMAAMVAGILVVAGYFLTSLARVVDGLKGAARFSPFAIYQSGFAVDGLNLGWFFSLLAVAAVLILAAGWAYQRRDLRVSGEGNWNLPRLPQQKAGE
jgi:ABC-2 type transport system permease protein